MNLPASAHEFLDAFLYLREIMANDDKDKLIWVHCYVFSKIDECPIKLVENELKCELEKDSVLSHYVRNVSPNKDMHCVSFKLPKMETFTGKKPKLE